MYNSLKHHGILGQKWGVRRTPEQLGHVTGGKSGSSSSTGKSASTKGNAKKSSEKSSKRAKDMSDEELRQRIQRLNMEEQYENLVARQKARNTGAVKKALGDAFAKFGRGALDVAVGKALDKFFKKDDKFDIDQWKNADVNDMDAETIQKVSRWYANAQSITKARSSLTPSTSDKDKDSSSGSSSNTNSGKSDDLVKQRREAMRRLGTR